MNPGKLNKKIQIVKYERVRNSTGGYLPDPQKVVVLETWASVRPLSGRAYWEAQSEQLKISHEVIVRFNPKITRELFVVFFDKNYKRERKFEIKTLLDVNEAYKQMKLHCEEQM